MAKTFVGYFKGGFMDNFDVIKERYASEVVTYRKEAPLVIFDAQMLFEQLLDVVDKIFPDANARIKILDIGAGNGMLTELILNKYPNSEITMLDFSPEMLQSAEAYFEMKNLKGNIKHVVSNFITDDLPQESFDLIISSYALHHIRNEEDLGKVFLKIAKALREDIGTFVCTDLYLGTGEEQRKKQVEQAITKWTENFGKEETAYEWGRILKYEDSPATVPTIMSLLNECRPYEVTPLLSNKCGIMATLYGMTKLSLEEIRKLELYNLISSWKDNTLPVGATENEHKIGMLPFEDNN